MTLFPGNPRARLAAAVIRADEPQPLRVELYNDGLFINNQRSPLCFGDAVQSSIARLVESIAALECPDCGVPVARDVWHIFDLGSGCIARCRECERRFRVFDRADSGLHLVALEDVGW